MKKTIFAIAVLTLISCGGSSESVPTTDSTVIVDSVVVDSTLVSDTTQDIQDVGGGIQDGSEIK